MKRISKAGADLLMLIVLAFLLISGVVLILASLPSHLGFWRGLGVLLGCMVVFGAGVGVGIIRIFLQRDVEQTEPSDTP